MPHGPRFEKLAEQAKAELQEVSAVEAQERHARGAVLIDVRETDEFEKAHAAGALHLSKGVLEMKIEQQVPDPETEIVCYCGGGFRSALAALNLQKMGYTHVRSLAGGFKAWQAADLPTE